MGTDPELAGGDLASVLRFGLRQIAVDWIFTNIGVGPGGSKTPDRRSALKLENNHRGPLTKCPRGSPHRRGVRPLPGLALEPVRFAINPPVGSCFDAASAGDPKKNRARVFVEG